MYEPGDKFSRDMLLSIPIKIRSWLDLMRKKRKGEFEGVTWKFLPKSGSVTVTTNDVTYSIVWKGSFLNQDSIIITGSEQFFKSISFNLKDFIRVERAFYDVFERMQEAYEAENAILIPIPNKNT